MTRVVVSLILLSSISTLVNSDTVTVESKSGRIVGDEVHFSHKDVDIKNTVNVFKGIPYAVPPVGKLRFKPPLPVIPWTGDYNATYLRPACIQAESTMIPLNEPTDEDCLHLNIYAPKSVSQSVMVWIHGGGFVLGSGSNVYYDGFPLAAINDVIVVGINYRLGVLGFLSTGDDVISGNYGLMDQLEALKWIKANIEYFGGDPDRITIFGESAGSISVNLHIFSPMSKGLFKRAIMQSGVSAAAFTYNNDKEMITKLAHGVGELVGCKSDTSDALLQCLRDVTPADRFLDVQDLTTGRLEKVTGLKGLYFPFLPCIDGHFVTDDPVEMINDERIIAIDAMMGSMANENIVSLLAVYPEASNWSSVTMNRHEFEKHLPTFSPVSLLAKGPLVVEAVKLLYTDWYTIDTPKENYTSAFVSIFSDEAIVCPTNTLAHAMSKSGSNVYLYQMSYSASRSMWGFDWTKAAHGDDLQFVFGWHFRSQNDWQMSPEDVDVSLQMMKYWTNFAKTGDPNQANEYVTLMYSPEDFRSHWPTFNTNDAEYKDITLEMNINRSALKAQECAFWTKYVPKLVEYIRENPDCKDAEVDAKTKYTKMENIP
ncbi:acetylcholinesterase-like [Saccoglossus kowalevskii]